MTDECYPLSSTSKRNTQWGRRTRSIFSRDSEGDFFFERAVDHVSTIISSSDKLRPENCPLVYVLGWIVFPQNWYVEVKPLVPRNMTVFGDRAFRKVIKVKWGHIGGALIQYDWCPYKNRRLGHRHREKTTIYMPRGEASEETSPADILDFQPPELWENKLLLFRPPSLWHFITAALTKEYSLVICGDSAQCLWQTLLVSRPILIPPFSTERITFGWPCTWLWRMVHDGPFLFASDLVQGPSSVKRCKRTYARASGKGPPPRQ